MAIGEETQTAQHSLKNKMASWFKDSAAEQITVTAESQELETTIEIEPINSTVSDKVQESEQPAELHLIKNNALEDDVFSASASPVVPVTPSPYQSIAPVPLTIESTKVSAQLLRELLLKHLFDKTVATVNELSIAMGLSGSIIRELIQQLQDDALLMLSTGVVADNDIHYRLTDKGHVEAKDAVSRSGYIGVCPVELSDYFNITHHFSIQQCSVRRKAVLELFEGFIIPDLLLDQLGAAFNSHRPIFVYGGAGTGKTYTIGKMTKLYGDDCLIPHAIASGDTIIQVYDPQIHMPSEELDQSQSPSLRYEASFDQRFVACSRPIVVVGGELTLDQLDVSFDSDTRLYQAPLQLKANCGVFIIDDMGRQAVSPKEIFNRWIVPMEEQIDYVALKSGQHFKVPFDLQLVFSSNINPLDLADEAFLRRIGFKIKFNFLNVDDYRDIWLQELDKVNVPFDKHVFGFLMKDLYAAEGKNLAACQPRDLINTAVAQMDYLDKERRLDTGLMQWAWDNYFVNMHCGHDGK